MDETVAISYQSVVTSQGGLYRCDIAIKHSLGKSYATPAGHGHNTMIEK